MLDLILNGDKEAVMTAVIARAVVIFTAWLMIIGACLVDFWAGISAAKANKDHIHSHGLRKTIEKISDYFKVALVALMIDVLGSVFAWYALPYATILCSVAVIIIEGKSVFENMVRKKSNAAKVLALAERITEAKSMEEAKRIIADTLEIKDMIAKNQKWKDMEEADGGQRHSS